MSVRAAIGWLKNVYRKHPLLGIGTSLIFLSLCLCTVVLGHINVIEHEEPDEPEQSEARDRREQLRGSSPVL